MREESSFMYMRMTIQGSDFSNITENDLRKFIHDLDFKCEKISLKEDKMISVILNDNKLIGMHQEDLQDIFDKLDVRYFFDSNSKDTVIKLRGGGVRCTYCPAYNYSLEYAKKKGYEYDAFPIIQNEYSDDELEEGS